MSTTLLNMTKGPTEGHFIAKISGAQVFNANTLYLGYSGDSLSLYGTDSGEDALLTSVNIDVAGNIVSGTYEYKKHSDFRNVWVRYNGLPYIFVTESATLHITANHSIKHAHGTCKITAVAFNDPDNRIIVEAAFDLKGGNGIPVSS
ncbi:hypothetical protein IFT37_02660 [Pseudomonas fluorescens]|uniref:Uncharacterized protein n=1 Tax=Pseudomonas fluorescens TaxID=294 RepID=A0AAE2Q1G1_PSEFL|nr:hypothetical protein [Pseudomonas fluorescens]MBD8147073.1 hypothetical protein [Pseudomonas fluorescens]MBD8175545.1 hypothetical protein [Pseudomonas fluorescens]MBD8271969.1 hypothetical protein [Pseudomonas fluorescens]MBD8744000.1 hypothetical protein [Pseudomonas fluorescens]MBD8750276.1 hypothetical protein [Pseudomonas fluorescens]